MFNVSWPKWIWASFAKHFYDAADDAGILIHIEGEERKTQTLAEYSEFRLLGPQVEELSKNCFRFECRLNILVSVDEKNINRFRVHEIGGIFLASFATSIAMLKLGSAEIDDQDQFGCMDIRGKASWNYYGKIKDDTTLLQGTVDGRYQMTLST